MGNTMEAEQTETIVGTLARDPEIRYDRDGSPVTTLQVARVTCDVADDHVIVQVRGLAAENVALSLTKGCRVVLADVRTERVCTIVGAELSGATVDVHRVALGGPLGNTVEGAR